MAVLLFVAWLVFPAVWSMGGHSDARQLCDPFTGGC